MGYSMEIFLKFWGLAYCFITFEPLAWHFCRKVFGAEGEFCGLFKSLLVHILIFCGKGYAH